MSLSTSKIHAIHHVSLVVANCHQSLALYRDILGLELDPGRPDLGYPGAWLMIGSNQQLHLMEFPEQVKDQKTRRDQQAHPGHNPHLALAVENLADIRSKLERVNIEYTLSRSGRTALFCNDHDGNALELIEV